MEKSPLSHFLPVKYNSSCVILSCSCYVLSFLCQLQEPAPLPPAAVHNGIPEQVPADDPVSC